MVSDKAGQPKCCNSAIGANSTDQVYFLALWWAKSWGSSGSWKAGSLSSFLSTSGNTVVAVSSLILSPKSLRKSHGYLVGSPWQWRKQIFQIFVVKHLLLWDELSPVTVWLGWLIPCAGELGCPNCRLMRSRGSGRDILQQLRRRMKIQVCFLANLRVHSEWHRVWLLLFWVLQTQLFPLRMSSGPMFSLNGLAGPIPLKTEKKSKTPNITRHNVHLPCFLFKKKNKLKVQ